MQKVLTAAQMREVDRLTIEDGVPSIALMENAAHRVVEELVRERGLSVDHVTVLRWVQRYVSVPG